MKSVFCFSHSKKIQSEIINVHGPLCKVLVLLSDFNIEFSR
jgi:hypothetical protein